VTDRAFRRNDDNTYDTTPADSAKFAKMLEQSSLGSADSRSARRLGAEAAAEFPTAGATWLQKAPRWPDIAAEHHRAAELFEAEGQVDVSELWLRAALFRTVDGPLARRLAVLLEKTGKVDDAYRWYLQAMDCGDAVAAGRLAVMAAIAGAKELASLLVLAGRSKIALDAARRADEMAGRLIKAGKRHSAKLVNECVDDDLLFWTGCVALASDAREAALTCFASAATTRGHDVAALALYDLTSRSQRGPDELADVQIITERIKNAVDSSRDDEAVHAILETDAGFPAGGSISDSLVLAASGGDREAVTRLLAIMLPLVVRYCRARLGYRSGLADEVAQEVCLSVVTALPKYRIQGRPFLGFVYGLAAHKVVDAHRALARNRVESVADVPDAMEVADGPEQRALHVELSSELRRMLDQLPGKHREILVLRIAVGLSAEETAAAVGSTPGAVRAAQHQALARLKKVAKSNPDLGIMWAWGRGSDRQQDPTAARVHADFDSGLPTRDDDGVDPITLVVAAVALGASAGLTDTASQVVKDAYTELKALLARRHVDVSGVERRPDSDTQRAALAETLTDTDTVSDEVVAAARVVTETVAEHAPTAASAIGVDLQQVSAAFLRIASVEATGTGVRVRDAEFSGGIDIGQVRAGSTGRPADPSVR
jgi:RNA polymerase sigma-70 factor, ECF subfamily